MRTCTCASRCTFTCMSHTIWCHWSSVVDIAVATVCMQAPQCREHLLPARSCLAINSARITEVCMLNVNDMFIPFSLIVVKRWTTINSDYSFCDHCSHFCNTSAFRVMMTADFCHEKSWASALFLCNFLYETLDNEVSAAVRCRIKAPLLPRD